MLNDIGYATHMWKYHKRGPSTPTSTDIYIYVYIHIHTIHFTSFITTIYW